MKHAPRAPGTRDRLVGLLGYLAGPGRGEEHTHQRIIAAWDETVTDLAVTDGQVRSELAREMESPARLFNTSRPREGFVFHVPISLHADDGHLSDEQWAYVARKTVAALGMEQCRWVAVHHGMAASAQGPRDHLHLVVHRAREDGTVASLSNSHRTMARLRAELEDDPTLGLQVTTNRRGGSRPGWSHGERDRAARAGRDEPDRERLERLVRAAVGAAESEGEWVQKMRDSRVLARPRYASGDRSRVVGYSVALQPDPGGRPVWYGGGKLARDLTLTAIRNRWDGHDPADALSAWIRTSSPERAGTSADSVWPRAQQALQAYTDQVRQIPLGEHAEWQAVTRETSELLAGLARHAPEAERARISRAARNLSRSAETSQGSRRGQPSRGHSAARTACQVLTELSRHLDGHTPSWGEVIQQVVSLVLTIRDARAAARDAAAVRQATVAKASLVAMDQRLNRGTQSSPAQHPARLAAMASPVSPAPRQTPGNRGPPGTGPGGRPPRRPGPNPRRGGGRGR